MATRSKKIKETVVETVVETVAPSTALTVLESADSNQEEQARDFMGEAQAAVLAYDKAKDAEASAVDTFVDIATEAYYAAPVDNEKAKVKAISDLRDMIPVWIVMQRLGVDEAEAIRVCGLKWEGAAKGDKRDHVQELAVKRGVDIRTKMTNALSKDGFWEKKERAPSAPKKTGEGEGKGAENSVPLGTIVSLEDAKDRIEKVREIIDGLFSNDSVEKLMAANPQHLAALVDITSALSAYIALPTKA